MPPLLYHLLQAALLPLEVGLIGQQQLQVGRAPLAKHELVSVLELIKNEVVFLIRCCRRLCQLLVETELLCRVCHALRARPRAAHLPRLLLTRSQVLRTGGMPRKIAVGAFH